MSLSLTNTFYLVVPSFPILALIAYSRAILRGLKRIPSSQIPESLVRPALLAGLVWLTHALLGKQISAPSAMALNVISVSLSLLLCALIMSKCFKSLPPIFSQKATYHRREWLGVALPLLFLSGISMLLNQTDKAMLGLLSTTDNVGFYAVASRIANLASFGLLAVNAISAPLISELYATNRRDELQKTLCLAAMGIATSCLPIAFVVVVFGHSILTIFGTNFVASYPALWVLTLGQTINALSGSVIVLMTMTGHQRVSAIIMGAAATLNILLNALLIPSMGLMGASLATAATTVIWNVTMVIYIMKKTELNPTILSLLR